jgi:hypothetical protein
MLETIDGNRIRRIAREANSRTLEQQLGETRCEEVREELNRIIDEMTPAENTGLRTFSSSYLPVDSLINVTPKRYDY